MAAENQIAVQSFVSYRTEPHFSGYA